MQTRNKIFDDISQLMTNAMGVAQGAKDEAETAMKGMIDRWLQILPDPSSLVLTTYEQGMGCWKSLPFPVTELLFKDWAWAKARAELAARLLEYQRYKEAAGELGERRLLGRDVFPAWGLRPEPPPEGEEPQEEKDIEDQLKDEAKKRLKDLLGGD